MVRPLVGCVTSLAVALAGCQVSTSPQIVATISDRNAPSMLRAPWTGSYTLYKIIPAEKKSQKPQNIAVQTVHLKKDEPLGFRVREKGPVAVAANLEIPVADGTYEWIMQADPGQTDPVLTTLLVVVIVAAIVITIAIINNELSHIDIFKNSH